MNISVIVLMVVLISIELVVLAYRLHHFRQLEKKTFPLYVGNSVIATSVLFTAVAFALVLLTESGNPTTCEVTIFTCIFLYTATKAQLYVFFIERIHVVYRDPLKSRLETPLYKINMCLLLPYGAIVVLMIIYRVSLIDKNGDCRIGLRDESTFPLLVYDTVFSTYSVALFVWPLYKSQMLKGSKKLANVVHKNVIGCSISTLSSFLNIFSLFLENEQHARGCLSYCALDVMVNVLVMHYLISGGGRKKKNYGESSMVNSSQCVGETSSRNIPSASLTTKVYPVTVLTKGFDEKEYDDSAANEDMSDANVELSSALTPTKDTANFTKTQGFDGCSE